MGEHLCHTSNALFAGNQIRLALFRECDAARGLYHPVLWGLQIHFDLLSRVNLDTC